MADPLHNKDYRDFNTRVSSSAGTGLDENRGKTMAYQAPLHDPIRKAAVSADHELPLEETDLDRRAAGGGEYPPSRMWGKDGGGLWMGGLLAHRVSRFGAE